MKEIYDWVPWFRELAQNIAEGGEAYLIDRAKQVDWGENPPLLRYGDEAINPFSFFYFLASKNTRNQLKPVYESVCKVFDIEPLDTDIDDGFFFPVPRFGVLFYDEKNPQSSLLWRLFRCAVEDNPKIVPDDFEKVLDIKGVGVPKLTQALFLINPEYFQSVDDTINDLSEALGLPALSDIQSEIKKSAGYKDYQSLLEKLRDAFPGCQPYEVNMFLYLQDSGSFQLSDRFYQISTHVYDPGGGDYWNDFEENNWVYTGGPGDARAYRLTDPMPGDIILVRTGRVAGKGVARAIGVVYQNDYLPDGWEKEGRIHVLWLNKSEGKLAKNTPILGFGKAGRGTETYKAFEGIQSYGPSFVLLNGLHGSSTASDLQTEPDAQQLGEEAMENRHPLNQILYGPPGTSKTWHTVNHALVIIDGKENVDSLVKESKEVRDAKMQRFDGLKENGQIEMVTFHQNYSYEDFIEGIRPVLANHTDEGGMVEYELTLGVFLEIVERAINNRKRNYVLIIDEINRGNIAKIFGELITLIEESKRIGRDDEATVTLPNSGEEFGVPDNLYIIGTMNTADRSIALLDTALRRRFDFVEMMPDSRLVPEDVGDVDCRKLLEAMNERIRFLLDREHQIGHTYLMNVKNMDSLATTFKNKIVPLLQEYFYDNWEKIDLVLNRNGFIEKRDIPENLRAEDQLIDAEKKVFEMLPADHDKWHEAESYQAIYGGKPSPPEDIAETEPGS